MASNEFILKMSYIYSITFSADYLKKWYTNHCHKFKYLSTFLFFCVFFLIYVMHDYADNTDIVMLSYILYLHD